MLDIIIPFALVISYFLYENIVVKNKKPKKSKTEFMIHVAEIRDMINRCDNVPEWWTLDQEIDWLEQTWKNRIDDALLLQECGRLYDKWFKRRDFITEQIA
jgi:inorganic triphosphatase YgiF